MLFINEAYLEYAPGKTPSYTADYITITHLLVQSNKLFDNFKNT